MNNDIKKEKILNYKFLNIFTCLIFFMFSYSVFINQKLNKINLIKNISDTAFSQTINKKNNEFLDSTIKQFENDNIKFIIADLEDKKLTIKNGSNTVEILNIITKGYPESYYETPAGVYSIKNKYENKFSTLGEVFMPYSMQFAGNYFIHGIPYHKDGTKVSTAYSGGCIRLQDNDAKKIYEYISSGDYIIVKNKDTEYESREFDKTISQNLLMTLTSLDIINQEKKIYDNMQVKDLNNVIINQNDEKAKNYIKNNIINYNEIIKSKANSIGISDVTFDNQYDRTQIFNYVKNNKKYLYNLINEENI